MSNFKSEDAGVAWFAKMCKSRGAWVQKCQMRFTVGFPDMIVVRDGITVFYEFKKLGERPTPLQMVTLRGIVAAGGYAYIVTMISRDLAILESPWGEIRRIIPNHPLLWKCSTSD